MDVSIIIVNFNTCELTLNAIQSVFQSRTDYSYEIILIDNASTDGSVDRIRKEYPSVHLIVNRDNLGFSKANNQGIRAASGRYILLLNSDTVMQPETLDVMVRFMEDHPEVGAGGCKVVLPDGTLDRACRRGFPTPLASFYYAFGFSRLFPRHPRFNQYQLSYLDPDQDYPVDSLMGAFMLVRKETIDQVGQLDEDFFMYGEDIDWCYRIKHGGWHVYYYPYTTIIHYKRASSRNKPFKIIYEFHRAMLLFHNKHYKRKYAWWVNLLVYLGIGIKFVSAFLSSKLSLSQR
ncbi:glycosyltransferase family 2 protein [Ferviditalea candida]|uniref:Glycosyltransferase family 2 protein n=1 Tax=Ferviditalea candida TaxID=3108399 RepID=A0ABU5ZNL5_9BACL|nr:glycosyltransferase family 2 protein [Paenibacillaceae bacterium T2]